MYESAAYHGSRYDTLLGAAERSKHYCKSCSLGAHEAFTALRERRQASAAVPGFAQAPDFGQTVYLQIPRASDMTGRTYLTFRLPGIRQIDPRGPRV